MHETAQSRCDEKISSSPACVGNFFVFPVVVVCMRLLNPDVMKRKVVCPLVAQAPFFCFSGGCCLHETASPTGDEKKSSLLPACVGFFFFCSGCCLHEIAQSRCDEKRSSLPACEARTYSTTIAKYRHFSCYRLPPRALPPKNETPSTVKNIPSCCITAEILPAYFSFIVSVKAVTVTYRTTVYRRKITVVSYHHRHNYRHILVLPFPSRQLSSHIKLPSTVGKLPSCLITTDIITGTFWFYRFCQGSYRQKTKYRLPSAKLPASGSTALSEIA